MLSFPALHFKNLSDLMGNKLHMRKHIQKTGHNAIVITSRTNARSSNLSSCRDKLTR